MKMPRPEEYSKDYSEDNGFPNETEAILYMDARKRWWGPNLVGWVEERDGRWYPCFNLWD